MNVKGKHLFAVNREPLWNYLMDPEVLAKITPGVSDLEVLGPDEYKSISTIKIGPVKGSFSGKLRVIDKNEPEAFTIEIEQLSKIGNGHGAVQMFLNAVDDQQTELSFDGKARLSGLIARTGQRVLSGVANTISKEVFASLDPHNAESQTNASSDDAVA